MGQFCGVAWDAAIATDIGNALQEIFIPCPNCQKTAMLLDISVITRALRRGVPHGRSIEVRYEVKDSEFVNVLQA
jgi:hypothetical protein